MLWERARERDRRNFFHVVSSGGSQTIEAV